MVYFGSFRTARPGLLLAIGLLVFPLTAGAQPEVSIGTVSIHEFEGTGTDPGIGGGGAINYRVGASVAVGDVTQDGIPDVAIGVVDGDAKNDGFVCVVKGPVPEDSSVEDLADLCDPNNVDPNALRLNAPESDKICTSGDKAGDVCVTGPDCTDNQSSHPCADRWQVGSFGSSVHIGFVTCDGLPSLIIGDPNHDEVTPGGTLIGTGAVLVLTKANFLRFSFGSSVDIATWGFLHVFRGAQGDHLGYVSSGDVDGDGNGDLIMGAPTRSSLQGAVMVQGSSSPTDANLCGNTGSFNNITTPYAVDSASGCSTGDCPASHYFTPAGTGLFGVGLHVDDVNGDGNEDLMIGAVGNVAGTVPAAVFIGHGPYGEGSYTFDVNGSHQNADVCIGCDETTDDIFGWSIDSQDCNADGRPELLVGAPGYDGGGLTNTGALLTYYGGTYDVDRDIDFATQAIHGSAAGDNLGYGVASGTAFVDDAAPGQNLVNAVVLSGYNLSTDVGGAHVLFDPCNCVDTSCDTGDACLQGSCNGQDTCVYGPSPQGTSCTDGNVCNGSETCDGAGVCQDGTTLDCDDGFSCTTDSCLAAPDDGGGCVNLSLDSLCSPDGLYCNGEEQCDATAPDADPTTGCVVRNAPNCDDSIDCTIDVCDEGTDSCLNVADDGNCPDDGLHCNGNEQCTAGVGCTSTGDPCAGQGACIECNEDSDICEDTDYDADLLCASEDNCPVNFNPDQLDSDCPDLDYYDNGCCDGSCNGGVVPPLFQGCCPNLGQGGDVCDDCAATRLSQRCDTELSGGLSIGPDGGTFTVGDCLTLTVPPGAVPDHTSFAITSGADESTNPDVTDQPTRLKAVRAARKVILTPDGFRSPVPVTFEFCWSDADDDGRVDMQACQGDDTVRCSTDAFCQDLGLGDCVGASPINENRLTLRRDGRTFDWRGFVGAAPDLAPGPARKCLHAEQNVSAGVNDCGSGIAANCGDTPGRAEASVAECCDDGGNTWAFQTCNFSEYYHGDPLGDMIPGAGSPKKDCVMEMRVVNAFNSEGVLDKRGFPNIKQTCRDGDISCDSDGLANGQCAFEVAFCLNVDDNRLVDKRDQVVCTPTNVAKVQVKKPSPGSSKPGEASSGQSMLDALLGLASSSTTGSKQDTAEFSPSVFDQEVCTETATVVVPLKGPNQDRRGKLNVKLKAETEPVAAQPKPVKDADKLQLTCLPAL